MAVNSKQTAQQQSTVTSPMKTLNGIKLAVATVVLVASPLIATICWDSANDGPCQTAGYWIQTKSCQVNCSCPGAVPSGDQVCVKVFTRTNTIYASPQYNLTCTTNRNRFLTCSTFTLSDRCQYVKERFECPTGWTIFDCNAITLEYDTLTGPLTGTITPDMCPYPN